MALHSNWKMTLHSNCKLWHCTVNGSNGTAQQLEVMALHSNWK